MASTDESSRKSDRWRQRYTALADAYGQLSSLEKIVSVLAAHKAVTKAVIFGSRAMDNNKNGSDIDIAVDYQSINHWHLSWCQLRACQ